MKIRNIIYSAAAIVFAIGLIIGFTLSVHGTSNIAESQRNEYLKARGEEYKEIIRDYLDEEGYNNAGLMLTYVTESDGSRTYFVSVHHKRLDALTEAEADEFKKDIASLSFGDNECFFEVTIK